MSEFAKDSEIPFASLPLNHRGSTGAATEYRGLVYKRPDFELSNLNSDVVTHTAQPSAGIVSRF